MNNNLTQTHFQLFNLPAQFTLDRQALSETYRDLQRQYHPDRFAGKDDQARRMAMQKTTQINEAYQTLKSPLQRAIYLLALQGIESDPQVTPPLPGDFLLLQMELREQLESINTQADPATALMAFDDTISGHIETLEDQFPTLFATQKFNEAQDTIHKLQFFYKLQQEAEKLEDSI